MSAWTEWQEELPGKNGNKGPIGDAGLGDTVSLALPGMIIMWFGLLEDLPITWVVCDGLNGTPDLRGLFVYDYSTNPYRQLALHSTGGSKDSIVPTHYHSVTNAGHFHTFAPRPAIWNFHDVIDYNSPPVTGFFADWTTTGYHYWDGLDGRATLVWPPNYGVPGIDTDIWTGITVNIVTGPFLDRTFWTAGSPQLWTGNSYSTLLPPTVPEPNLDNFPPYNPSSTFAPLQTLSNITINTTGVDGVGKNMPPYLALYYIMYIGEV